MLCGDFILPESAIYVSLFLIWNLRNLLYLIIWYVQTAENLFLNAAEPWKETVMEGAKSSTNAKTVKGVRIKQNAVSRQKATAQWE